MHSTINVATGQGQPTLPELADLLKDDKPLDRTTTNSWEDGTGVHLRVCQECGHVGCCDNSPGRPAAAHFRLAGHPVVRWYEPGEDWYWCYLDRLVFELDGAPALSHL